MFLRHSLQKQNIQIKDHRKAIGGLLGYVLAYVLFSLFLLFKNLSDLTLDKNLTTPAPPPKFLAGQTPGPSNDHSLFIA